MSLVAAICILGSAAAQEDTTRIPVAKLSALTEGVDEPAPIVVWNRTIAVLRATFEEVGAAGRAQRAVARIRALAARGDWEIKTTHATLGGIQGIVIGTKTDILFALVPEDLDPESGETLEAAAAAAARTLKAVLDERAKTRKWSNILRGIGFSAAATVVYVLIMWLLFRVTRFATTRLDRFVAGWRRAHSIAGVNVVPVLLGLERALSKLLTLALVVAASYIWLTFCFARFFWTEPWAYRLSGFLINLFRTLGVGILQAIPGIFTAFVIFWLARIVAASVSRFFTSVEHGIISVTWLQPDSARASRRIAVLLVWGFAFVVAYPFIPGSGTVAFKGISVLGGLMISLGSTGLIGHVMSGLMIAYSGSMRVGDYVQVGDVEGTVEELGTTSVKIRTPKQQLVTVPNGVAVGSSVTNYTRLAGQDGAGMSIEVTIGYNAPWRQVHALLIKAAERTDGVRKSPPPVVLQRALSDFYVKYMLRFNIDRPEDRWPILSKLHAEVQDAFNEAGVQIMSPHFRTQPENEVVVPKSKWYVTPGGSGTKDQDTASK